MQSGQQLPSTVAAHLELILADVLLQVPDLFKLFRWHLQKTQPG